MDASTLYLVFLLCENEIFEELLEPCGPQPQLKNVSGKRQPSREDSGQKPGDMSREDPVEKSGGIPRGQNLGLCPPTE